MARDERWHTINRALAELPEAERRVLWLHDGLDLTVRQVAEAIGTRPEEVERLYAGARSRVNARLQEHGLAELEWTPRRPSSLDAS